MESGVNYYIITCLQTTVGLDFTIICLLYNKWNVHLLFMVLFIVYGQIHKYQM